KDSTINKVADLKGKKVAMVRGTDPHIFAVRALLAAGLSGTDITPVLVQQHADGGNLLIRGDVDAWAGLDPMMAQHEIKEGARLFYRNRDANTWGILNVREEYARDPADVVRRVISAYEEARKYSLAHYDELKKTFITVTKLPDAVVDKQLKERTELTHNKVGPAQRDSILEAGLALQKAGVIGPSVDIKKAVDDLIDDRYVTAANLLLWFSRDGSAARRGLGLLPPPLGGGGGGGGARTDLDAMCPLPVPPPRAGEGTMRHLPSTFDEGLKFVEVALKFPA